MQQDFDRNDLIIASLTQQIARLSRDIADREATIAEQHSEIDRLMAEQIDEMNKGVKKDVKK